MSSFMKGLVIGILIGMLVSMLLFAVARAEDETQTMYCICSDSRVNVRAKPSTKSRIEGYLEFGWDCEVSRTERDSSGTLWYRVEGMTELGYGYVCANYLMPSKPERVSMTAVVKADGRVAAYNRPDGSRKSWIRPMTELTVSIWSDIWCLTDKGYVRTKYLEVRQ